MNTCITLNKVSIWFNISQNYVLAELQFTIRLLQLQIVLPLVKITSASHRCLQTTKKIGLEPIPYSLLHIFANKTFVSEKSQQISVQNFSECYNSRHTCKSQILLFKLNNLIDFYDANMFWLFKQFHIYPFFSIFNIDCLN